MNNCFQIGLRIAVILCGGLCSNFSFGALERSDMSVNVGLFGTGGVVDKRSLGSLLAAYFREIAITNQGQLVLTVMERPITPIIRKCGDVGGRRLHVDERFVMDVGSAYEFLVRRGSGGLTTLSLVPQVDLIPLRRICPGFGDAGGPFLRVAYHLDMDHRADTPAVDIEFVVDIGGERFVDVVKKTSGTIHYPFVSPWQTWVDYEERFYGRKTDCLAMWQGGCDEQRNFLMGSKRVREFAGLLDEGGMSIVRYGMMRDSWTDKTVCLAWIRKCASEIEVLGFGQFREDGVYSVWLLDAGKRLALASSMPGGGDTYAYELAENGAVSRFVELDASGAPLPSWLRNVKRGEMVAPSDRPAFLKEVDGRIRKIVDAYLKKEWVDVRDSALPPVVGLEAAISNVVALRRKVLAEERRIDEERLRKGLPVLTPDEKYRQQRENVLSRMGLRLAVMRLRLAGLSETNAVATAVDGERARLFLLGSVAKAQRRSNGGAWPKTGRELLDFREGPERPLVLFNGESDLVDAWGRKYEYRVGKNPLWPEIVEHGYFTSLGEDGVLGTADDLTSDDMLLLRKRMREQGLPEPD